MQKGHSESFFTDYRDFWWNKDFLDIIAQRLALYKYQNVLDVGCGQCHWSKLLADYLAYPAHITGIDNDTKWSQNPWDTWEYFNSKQAGFDLVHGNAHQLPFEDNTFDMVTCQTLLIHVKNPLKVIQEMKRVLKPKGLILCVEPNNRVQHLMQNSLTENNRIEETLDHVKYALICEQGKKRLGQGDNSIGDLIPGMLQEAGFRDLNVSLSDKAIAMYPPYTNEEQQATMAQWKEGSTWQQTNFSDREYFEAFGDQYMAFYEAYHQRYPHAERKLDNAIHQQNYHAGGGALMYLVSGVK